MKNVILLILVYLMFGCETAKQLEELSFIPKKELFYTIDFSRFTEQGFLITPEKYSEKYKSIGLVTYEYLPSGTYKLVGLTKNPFYNPQVDKTEPEYLQLKNWVFEPIHYEKAMDSLYIKCKSMGADALVNFRIEVKSEEIGVGYKNSSTVKGLLLSGFAIKRE